MAADKLQCPVERRHREMMAATIASGLLTHRQGRYYEEGGYGALTEDSTALARAIQAEVAAVEGGTSEPSPLSAVCPVPPFPGIRGGGEGE